MGRKGVKNNQAESGFCNSIKTYMVQGKTDQRTEQIFESVEVITPVSEGQISKTDLGEEGALQKDQGQQRMEKETDSLQSQIW